MVQWHVPEKMGPQPTDPVKATTGPTLVKTRAVSRKESYGERGPEVNLPGETGEGKPVQAGAKGTVLPPFRMQDSEELRSDSAESMQQGIANRENWGTRKNSVPAEHYSELG